MMGINISFPRKVDIERPWRSQEASLIRSWLSKGNPNLVLRTEPTSSPVARKRSSPKHSSQWYCESAKNGGGSSGPAYNNEFGRERLRVLIRYMTDAAVDRGRIPHPIHIFAKESPLYWCEYICTISSKWRYIFLLLLEILFYSFSRNRMPHRRGNNINDAGGEDCWEKKREKENNIVGRMKGG